MEASTTYSNLHKAYYFTIPHLKEKQMSYIFRLTLKIAEKESIPLSSISTSLGTNTTFLSYLILSDMTEKYSVRHFEQF